MAVARAGQGNATADIQAEQDRPTGFKQTGKSSPAALKAYLHIPAAAAGCGRHQCVRVWLFPVQALNVVVSYNGKENTQQTPRA